MGATLEFSLPPISALSFVPFLFLQAILLQPTIPSRISRVLRILLCIPAVYFAALAPFQHRIEPVKWAIGANFRWGIFGPNFIMKALEWGFARDRSAFVWIGFDHKGTSQETIPLKESEPPSIHEESVTAINTIRNGSATTRRPSSKISQLPTPPESPTVSDSPATVVPADLGIAGPHAPSHDPSPTDRRKKKTIFEVITDALHLATAMRGIGYAFGPPVRSLAGRQGSPPSFGHRQFVKSAVQRLIRSHIVSTTCLVLIIHRNDLVPAYLSSHLGMSTSFARGAAQVLAHQSVGFSLYAQMLIGFEGASLIFLALHYLPRPLKVPFDAREWPPLFDRPFDMTSVTEFWGKQWHALFRKPFTSVGYEPVSSIAEKVLGRKVGKQLGRMLGAIVVFGLSAWLHDQALWSARYGLSPSPVTHLTFLQRHGANLFFLIQSLAVILESTFKSITGRKVGGSLGRIWSTTLIFGVGCLAGRSWIALGLVEGLPRVEDWGWQRWILPTVALAPPPLYVK